MFCLLISDPIWSSTGHTWTFHTIKWISVNYRIVVALSDQFNFTYKIYVIWQVNVVWTWPLMECCKISHTMTKKQGQQVRRSYLISLECTRMFFHLDFIHVWLNVFCLLVIIVSFYWMLVFCRNGFLATMMYESLFRSDTKKNIIVIEAL